VGKIIALVAAATSLTACMGPLHDTTPAAGLNEVVREGRFAFTVKSVDMGVPKVGRRTAEGVFVVVQIAVRNIGDDLRSVYCQNQRLKDLAGKTYHDGVTVGGAENMSNIKPGKEAQFECAFDVRVATLPGVVDVHDLAFSRGVAVTVLGKR
jgi:Domain of unknown function (DUF4352)